LELLLPPIGSWNDVIISPAALVEWKKKNEDKDLDCKDWFLLYKKLDKEKVLKAIIKK
jgi:hypothetical protein